MKSDMRFPRVLFPEAAGSAAWTLAAASASVVLGAWFFQYVLSVQPCPLCLEQRKFHYVAIALAVVTALAASWRIPRRLVAGALVAIGLVLLAGALVAIYHSGVEWRWWAGPQDCSAPIVGFGAAGSLLDQIDKTSIVRCDEVGFRFLGLSLAGFNALLSTALGLAAVGAGLSQFARKRASRIREWKNDDEAPASYPAQGSSMAAPIGQVERSSSSPASALQLADRASVVNARSSLIGSEETQALG